MHHDKAITESKHSFLALQNRNIVDEFTYEKAETLYLAGDYQQSIKLIDEVLVARPRYTEILFLKLKVLIAMEDYPQANQVIALIDNYWQDADADYSEYIKFLAEKQSLIAASPISTP